MEFGRLAGNYVGVVIVSLLCTSTLKNREAGTHLCGEQREDEGEVDRYELR